MVAQFALLGLLVLVPHGQPTAGRVLVAAVPLVAGIGLGLWASLRLGSALTPTPVPIAEAGLRTDGPYAHLRHPIYSAVLLISLAVTIAFGSAWTVGVLMLLVVFFLTKARWEDSLLREAYGPAWDSWAQTTGALVPRWGQRS